MAEGLKKILTEDAVRALKEGQKLKLSVLRLLLSEIKNREFEKRKALEDKELCNILRSMANRYRDAIPKFKAGGREDLVKKEEEELKILESYLPEQISREEIDNIINGVIDETGVASIKDMGMVMRSAIERVNGRADNKLISDIVRQKLETPR